MGQDRPPSPASNGTTIDIDSGRRAAVQAHEATADVLVIAWSAFEPTRVGEVSVLAAKGPVLVLGRGDGSSGEIPSDEARLRWFRQRPASLVESGPLASPGLSRRQLVVHPGSDGATLERVGRCSLVVNGARVESARIQPGDVVRLGRELVLLCTRRPALAPAPRLFPKSAWRDFGEPDATGILGESPQSWRLREGLAFAAKADTHVLVLGESGSGKELAARAIHLLSPRAPRPFVARNAATLPSGLIDAELFGNARNYPNPGMPERAGLVGEADGGTLFLDEIGELSSELQAHLLRVLDRDGEYQRLGESTVRRSNFRLVAATNRDPTSLKHDFVARFTARVELPNLDARREDIPLIARGLLLRAARRSPEIVARFIVEGEREEVRVDPALVEAMLARAYPTNVRDLDAFLWQALADSGGDAIEPPRDRNSREMRRSSDPPERRSVPTSKPDPSAADVRTALAAHDNNIPRAARALGLSSRYALYRLLKKYGIEASSADS